ncbi:MAG: CRISPR system precrRNA processing endoribonuclease RAMP protein Cas6 [Gallionellaceae bacterium]
MSLAENQLPPLRILPLRFLLRSQGLHFPEFSGSVWHGGLGMILAQHSQEAFRRLYQTDSESRLYTLRPPMRTQIPAGEQFELQLTLFGYGVDHALAVTQAIAELGKVGMRPGGYYELIEASAITPESTTPFLSEQEGFLAAPKAVAAHEYLPVDPQQIDQCRIHFITPLRIKEGNDLLRKTPTYAQLLRRTFGRIDQLAHAAGEMPSLAKSLRAELYEKAERVEINASSIKAHVLERRSTRSGQQMQFGGIIGTVDYVGAMQTTLPWLQLARLAQLGGKTAFGFGGLEIEVLNS